jgi:hypothetical protein
MQARFSTPSSLAAHHRRLMASCAESGCPQVQQRSGAKLSVRTVGESPCISKSVEAHYKGPNSERQGPTNRMSAAMFSGSPHSTRATMSDRTERQVTSESSRRSDRNAKIDADSQHQDQPSREMQHGRHRRHCSPDHHRTLPRGVMITLPQGDLLKDSGILRTAAQHNGVNVGIYASVINGGRNRRGDRSCSPELGLTAALAAAR